MFSDHADCDFEGHIIADLSDDYGRATTFHLMLINNQRLITDYSNALDFATVAQDLSRGPFLEAMIQTQSFFQGLFFYVYIDSPNPKKP